MLPPCKPRAPGSLFLEMVGLLWTYSWEEAASGNLLLETVASWELTLETVAIVVLNLPLNSKFIKDK